MLRKVLVLIGASAILAYAASTPPSAAGSTCSPANMTAILAAIPLCSQAC